MRIVGSMTTLPDRLTTVVEPIRHILRQTYPLGRTIHQYTVADSER